MLQDLMSEMQQEIGVRGTSGRVPNLCLSPSVSLNLSLVLHPIRSARSYLLLMTIGGLSTFLSHFLPDVASPNLTHTLLLTLVLASGRGASCWRGDELRKV